MRDLTPSVSYQISLFSMKVVLVNLSNQRYAASRARLNASAQRQGIHDIRSWDFEDIKHTSFYDQHRNILDQPRGMGYWLWKPYILLEAIKDLSDGDIVIYCDSGIEIIAPLDPLLAICRDQQQLLLFGNGNFINASWTKRDCFILTDCDRESCWKGPQCDAAFMLVRRSSFTLKFLQEWLQYASDPRILTDLPNTSGKRNLPDFISHRHDQSILSLLAQKYQVSLYRIPSQFGNHYKMYPYRLESEFNCINQYQQQPVNYYAAIPYYNSPYSQLLDHHREQDKGMGGNTKKLPLILRIIKKRYTRLVNTIALRRES